MSGMEHDPNQQDYQALFDYFENIHSQLFSGQVHEAEAVFGLEGWAGDVSQPWGLTHFFQGQLEKLLVSLPASEEETKVYTAVKAGNVVAVSGKKTFPSRGGERGFITLRPNPRLDYVLVQKITDVFDDCITEHNFITFNMAPQKQSSKTGSKYQSRFHRLSRLRNRPRKRN